MSSAVVTFENCNIRLINSELDFKNNNINAINCNIFFDPDCRFGSLSNISGGFLNNLYNCKLNFKHQIPIKDESNIEIFYELLNNCQLTENYRK